MKGIRIIEFFPDFDKLRKGHVTKDQFRRVISMLGFDITKGEYEALENKYGDPETGFFNYAQFCGNIDKIFTLKGIDKEPKQEVKQTTVDDVKLARRKQIVQSVL